MDTLKELDCTQPSVTDVGLRELRGLAVMPPVEAAGHGAPSNTCELVFE
jgi:hypothetical protein